MNQKDIRLDLITIDAGTQQRPLDEDTLRRYTILMADGVEFPAVEVVSDGVNFWLWDGFHRVECAKLRSQKTIPAYVTEGKLRDAIWLSFGANKEHGLPRQKGIAGKIISSILIDTSWSKKSLSEIARHVGVTRQYVTKLREELPAHGATSLHDTVKESGDSEPKTAQGATRLHLSRAPEIEVQTKTGIPYTQRSQEKQRRAAEPPKACPEPVERDAAGRVIPEPLRELYEGRKTIMGFVNDLARLKDAVMKHLDARDPIFFLLNTTAFQANYENLRRTLKSALPYAVCPYCGGDAKNCKACQGFGLLRKDGYDVAAKDLKL